LRVTKPSCTNQLVIIVIRGEMSSVEWCLLRILTSLGTSLIGFHLELAPSAYPTPILPTGATPPAVG
jgi:hypothetical protein